MNYSVIAEMYEKIESTTKRLEITDLLAELLKKTPKDDVDKVVYLTQGKLYPDYMGIEVGIAEKLALRAISQASGIKPETLEENLRKTGDIGETAANSLVRRTQMTLVQEPLTVDRVYDTLDKIARASGDGSQEMKIRLLASLISDSTPKETKYITRTITGKLRLGLADMTILDGLAAAYCGSKEHRPILERAYNIAPDLGSIAKAVAEKGLDGVKSFTLTVGKPLRPMLAERLADAADILEKLGGRGMAEYKYDGERLQAHINHGEVKLFSRRLEDVTGHYPDAVEHFRQNIKARKAIVECECVAVRPETGELLPFQELMHRRRKYQIEEARKLYPVSIFTFDILYLEGKDLTLKPYPFRRKTLERVVVQSERVDIAKATETSDVGELEKFFQKAVEDGCEGLIVKSVNDDSVYQAGARGWLWIKYKREYQALLTDTLDLTVVGAFYGRGKRAGSYGALLMVARNHDTDSFSSVCKVGSGFTDEDLEKLSTMLKEYQISHKHPRVDSKIQPDVWFTPHLVLEIIGAEITLSPIHTCGRDIIRKDSGLAIRFPRFTGNYRLDKAPEDSTTTKEIVEMYQRQLKRISEGT
ncbi:MAG: ATP-dependent DNA ligase [Candidatus Bathyarchaeia archaeon]